MEMSPILCAFASALLLLFRDSCWPLAWIAPVPLLWLAYGSCSLRKLILTTMASMLLVGGVAAGVALVTAGAGILLQLTIRIEIVVALFVACVTMAGYAKRMLHPILALLMYPAVATSASYLVMLVSGGDSAGNVAYTQVDVPVLIQSASLFGLQGIEFMLALFANGMALALRAPKRAPYYVGASIAVVAVNVAYGVIRLHAPAAEMLRVAAAAQDLPLNGRLPTGAESVSSITKAYAVEGRKLADLGAKVIAFPELIAVLTPRWRDQALAPFQSLAQESGAMVSVGFVDIGDDELVHNVALTFQPDNQMARYVKRHTLLPLDRSVRGTTDEVLGKGMALAICKDLDFQTTIRSDAQKNIRLMIVPAADFDNDGWIHARMSILRGVENGFAIVRAARNGLVTISDDRGRVIARGNTSPTRINHVIADVSLGSGDTLYRRMGDSFAWACVALSITLLALLYKSSAQERRVALCPSADQ
jgi:apolipoprotein N-acyltransferase